MDATETHTLPREPESFTRRAGERALLLATLAAVLARTPSILPRSSQDQALVSADAGVMGAACGLLAEAAVTALACAAPAGRRGASVLLGGLALTSLAWASRDGQRSRAAAVDTASRTVLVSSAGGELALAAYRRLAGHERSNLWRRSWTTALAAATAFGGLRQRLAEPRDLVKASIRYDFLPSVSGGEGSYLPLVDLDREGRKFLVFDLKNGIIVSPVFGAYAHDYRLELPRLLCVAFGHGDASDGEIEAIERATACRALVQEEREARARVGPRA